MRDGPFDADFVGAAVEELVLGSVVELELELEVDAVVEDELDEDDPALLEDFWLLTIMMMINAISAKSQYRFFLYQGRDALA